MSAALVALGYAFGLPPDAGSIDQTPGGWRIIPTTGNGFEFSDFADLADVPTYFFRCKQDHNRSLDHQVMRSLHVQYSTNQTGAF
jgi:hypothetical protein